MIRTLRLASALAAALLVVAGLSATPGALVVPVRAAAAAPAALPQDHLHFGLSNNPGDLSWMTTSGVPWRYRYAYLSGGVNTLHGWETWNSPTGAYATFYMNASDANGYIPVFTYYELLQSNPSTGGNESARDYSNLNNTTTMAAYYANFKLLMQLVGAFAKPVVVHVEPDLWGYLQQRAAGGDASTLSASVASSGVADIAAIPNTAQGFGEALLKLRDLYGPNALLAVHASMWSSGIDVAGDTRASIDAVAAADSTAAFLNSAGIAANPFGTTWDLVFNDVDDHDAGWWEQQGADNQYFTHWWDPTNSRFPNFSRYLSWVSELRLKTARPQIVWQVPVGNQYFLTMNNTCGHYQDNVAPYFITHATDLFAAGLIAVLFGAGNSCQTTNTDGMQDGITNNGGAPTSDSLGGCSACNTHTSVWADDDGGYLRIFVGLYYAALSCTATPLSTSYFNWYDHASPGVNAETIHLLNTGSTVSSGCLSIAGLALAPFSVNPGADSYFAFPAGVIGGPVVVNVDSGPPLLASKRSWYYQSLSETAARPASAAATTQYLPWYDLSSPGVRADTIHITNVSGAAASGSIALAGASSLAFNVADGQDVYLSFPQGTIGGPVTITSTRPVLASLRAWYYQTFNETFARPASAAATTQYFPWYDLSSPGVLADTIHITNESGSTASGTIGVGVTGVTPIPFTVPTGQDSYFHFPQGTIGGPVTITSSQPVLASLRAWYYQSFNETAARPASAAATTQHFPWYDLASPGMRADTIHITNVSGSTASGTIALPGATNLNFTVQSGQDSYFYFPQGTIGGPVTITSSQPVLASLRAWYYQSFNEVPGL